MLSAWPSFCQHFNVCRSGVVLILRSKQLNMWDIWWSWNECLVNLPIKLTYLSTNGHSTNIRQKLSIIKFDLDVVLRIGTMI